MLLVTTNYFLLEAITYSQCCYDYLSVCFVSSP